MSENRFETKDARDLYEISQALPVLLDTVTEKLPALIRRLIQTVFSEQAGRDLGKAVAAFYRELKASGMPESMVNDVMREYLRVQGGLVRKITEGGLELKERPEPKEPAGEHAR